VSFAVMLCLVLVGVYGLTSLLLSILVAVTWRADLDRMRSTSNDLLAMRLLPTGGAALLTLTVVLPAFLIYEPAHELEEVGPFLVALVLLALVTAGAGIVRGWRACLAGRALLRNCGRPDRWFMGDGQKVDLVDIPEPIVAVVGGWRPRIVAAKHVFGACSQEEFSRGPCSRGRARLEPRQSEALPARRQSRCGSLATLRRNPGGVLASGRRVRGRRIRDRFRSSQARRARIRAD
jgi:hypothetical protein